MKSLKYILLSFIAALGLYACSEEPIDRVLSSSDFFVTFETKNGNAKTVTITESDTTVVTITIGATKGNPVTVNFDVTAPTTTDPATALYKLLDMDNNELTEKILTFSEGTGARSFKFVAVDNDLVDGSRTFTLTLGSNSAGYKTGVGGSDEGATLPVAVKDDEVVVTMKELCGNWTVTEQHGISAWTAQTYTVTVDSVTSTTLQIKGFAADASLVSEGITLNASVVLDQKIKTITIPFQKLTPGWDEPTYDTYFFKYTGDGSQGGVDQLGFDNLVIDKADDGTLTIIMGTGNTYTIGDYDAGTMNYAGSWMLGAVTKLVKQPE